MPDALASTLSNLPPAELAGQLLVVGFPGLLLPGDLALALERRERAGVVLFKRNLADLAHGPEQVQALCAELQTRAGPGFPPIISIDEEGGRVARSSPPALRLPPMRKLADLGDVGLVTRVGAAVGRELGCLGLTLNFAPVVDVDTNPDNPIIGDRAFASTPEGVIEYARAYSSGLRGAGLQNCLKHYPGHGDTQLDSHLALPTVVHERQRLEEVELSPFRHLAADADSMMTAHVLYPHLDASRPATLSPLIATQLLREQIGFEGALFSDDLEMRAISEPPGEAAVLALRAGCDLLLVCSQADAQASVHEALTREIERDPQFRERCLVAARRSLRLRRARPPAPAGQAAWLALIEHEIEPLERELERRSASSA